MAQLQFDAPLSWPHWVPVTPLAYRQTDRDFAPSVTLKKSIEFLQQEIDALGCPARLSLDVENPLSERAKKVGSRPGAVLHLDYMGNDYVIACDKWQQMAHNIYAIHLAFRQWRNMERWGVAPLAVLLDGFSAQKEVQHKSTSINAKQSASPAGTSSLAKLGLASSATLDDAQAVYHRRAKKVADDSDALAELNNVMEGVRAYFAKQS